MYSVSYQHFTNSIENFFSMLKSKLQKLDGLTHEEIKKNIKKVLKVYQLNYMLIFLKEHMIEVKSMLKLLN